MPETFDAARFYDEQWTHHWGDLQAHGPQHRHCERILRGLLAPLAYRSVLDVGCGAGQSLALALAGRSGVRAVGTDVSPQAVAQARARVPAAEFQVLDIERERRPETFDLVMCFMVLEHLRDDAAGVARLAAQANRWVLLSTVQGTMAAHEREVGHFRNYTRAGLEALLRGAGLVPVRTVEWGFPFYSPVFRFVQSRLARPHGSASGRYGPGLRLLAGLLYGLYFLNSHRRGDVIYVLAEKRAA